MKNDSNLKERVKGQAAELFYRHGPKHVSMEEIADRSHISKKTLYKLFDSKHTIVQEVVDDLVQSHSEIFEDARSICNDAIDEVLEQDAGLALMCKDLRPRFFLDLETSFPKAWEELEQYKANVFKTITDNLDRGKAEGLYGEDVNIKLLADLRLKQLINIMKKELAEQFTLMYLRAISTEKGRKQLEQYMDERR